MRKITAVYTGPIHQEATTEPQVPPSAEMARVIALSAWRGPGRLQRTPHWLKRAKERNFTILDVEWVIKYGKVLSGPTACGEPHNNHKYYFEEQVDGIALKAAFALDATQDYAGSPLVILITAVWKTRSGCRNK